MNNFKRQRKKVFAVRLCLPVITEVLHPYSLTNMIGLNKETNNVDANVEEESQEASALYKILQMTKD